MNALKIIEKAMVEVANDEDLPKTVRASFKNNIVIASKTHPVVLQGAIGVSNEQVCKLAGKRKVIL